MGVGEFQVTKWIGKVTGVWRKLHNAGLNDLYCSSACVIRFIESRRMGLARLVA